MQNFNSKVLLKQILKDLKAAVSVVDIESHKILYLNPYAHKHLKNNPAKGDLCWRVLQNKEEGPCDFCKINELKKAKQGTVIKWDRKNESNGFLYENHDQLIEWEPGKMAKLKISYIKQKENIIRRKQKFSNEEIIEKFPYYTAIYEIVGTDKTPVLIDINEPGPQLHGYTKDELIGKPAEFLCIEDQKKKLKDLTEKILNEKTVQFIITHRKKDKTVIDFQVDAKLIKVKDRNLIYTIAQDITSRKQLLQKLSESRQKFKLLSSISSDLSFIYHLKQDGSYENEFVGGNFEKLTGYEYNELKQMGGRDSIVLNEDLPLLANQEKTLLKGKPFKASYRIRKKDGTISWVEDISFPVKTDDNNNVIEVYNTIRNITIEKKALYELQQREKKYADLYNLLKNMSDNADDMIWAKDMENKFTFVNKAIAKKLLNAKDTEEPLGKNEMFFVARERKQHPEDPKWFTFGEDCSNSDEIVKESGKPGHFDEYGNVMGKFLYLDVFKAPLRNEKGEMIGTVGFARNITRLKEIEKELQDNVKKFRSYLNALPIGILIFDKNGTILDLNPEITKLANQKEENIIGKNISEFVPPKNHLSLKKGMDILFNKSIVTGEGDFTYKNITKHLKYQGLKTDNDKFLGVILDITSQHQAENILRLNEQRYRTVFENLPNIAVQAYNKDREAIFWNDTSSRFYGYSKTEALGKKFEDLIIPEEKKEWTKEKIGKWLLSDTQTKPGEYLRRKKNGKTFMVYSSFIKIKNFNGETEFFSLDIDLTEIKETELKLKKALTELEESNATKDKIFSIIAHDLRAPFNSLLGFTDLLVNQYEDFSDEEIYDMILALKKNSEQAFNLLNNLLHWSRQQIGTIKYNPTLLFVHRIADEVIKSFHSNIEEKELSVINNIDKNAFAFCDKDLLAVVIRNLLSNAIKFTPEGKNIELTSSIVEDKLWINITDTGIGIPKENIDKVLNTKETFTTKGTADEKGTGLGLMLVQNFVKLNKGNFKVESEPDKGSTFSFSLPLSKT